MRGRVAIGAALLVAACSMGGGGALVADEGDGDADGTVTVRESGLTAEVRAQWATSGSQSAQLRYRNSGPAPVRVAIGDLRLRHRIGDAYLWSVSDMTGIDPERVSTGGNVPPVLFDGQRQDAAPALVVPARSERSFALGFTSYADTATIARGDRVTLVLPMGASNRTVNLLAR